MKTKSSCNESESIDDIEAARPKHHEDPTEKRLIAAVTASRTPATKLPKDTLKAVYAAGIYKANLPNDILFIQCFMAGMMIALAGHVYLSTGGGILGAAFFPLGLNAVILTSGELFTGDALVFVTSLLGRKVTWKQLVRNWTVAWIGNFLGSLTWAYFISFLSGAVEDSGQWQLAIKVAQTKTFQPWLHIFLKGIGANMAVCLGIWMATCAEEVAGKILALWFPISAFVIMGLEHCIANQYFLPLGMLLQAKHDLAEYETISVSRLFQALLPSTLGNIVGGGIMVGAIYWYAFDSMERTNAVRERIGQAWKAKPHYGEHHQHHPKPSNNNPSIHISFEEDEEGKTS